MSCDVRSGKFAVWNCSTKLHRIWHVRAWILCRSTASTDLVTIWVAAKTMMASRTWGTTASMNRSVRDENTTWTTGVSFSMPLGLRLARAQVRNYELRLRKAHAVLARQEVEIGYELSDAMINMEQNYLLAETGLKKAAAAKRYADKALSRLEVQPSNDITDPVAPGSRLEAKITSRDAESGLSEADCGLQQSHHGIEFPQRSNPALKFDLSFLKVNGIRRPTKMHGFAVKPCLGLWTTLHLRTVPEEFVGGPDVNSWESLGNPARPFEPGAVESVSPIAPATGELPPGMIVPDVPATEPESIAEPLLQTPNATDELKLPVEPAKPEKVDEFLDPVSYQAPVTPDSNTFIAPTTSKSIREFRSTKRNPIGRAQLD